MRLHHRHQVELVVAGRAVQLPRLLVALPDGLVAVPVAILDLEQRAQTLWTDDLVALERQRRDPIAQPLGDVNPQFYPPGLPIGRVLEIPERRVANASRVVPLVAVVAHHLVGVLFELTLLVAARPGQPREHPAPLVVLHLALERRGRHRFVAAEHDVADLDLRPLIDHERQVDQFRAAGQQLDLGRDGRELVALLPKHVEDDLLHLAHHAGIDERVEPDDGALLLQLVVDLRPLEVLRSDVVDDLDALALLHVVGDQLADDAVRERIVGHLDREVVEELDPPQVLEVLPERLGRLHVVPARPVAGLRIAGLRMDVEEIGFRLDDRRVALFREAQTNLVDHRPGSGRRQLGGRPDLLSAQKHPPLRERLGRRLRDGDLLGRRRLPQDRRLTGALEGRRGRGLEAAGRQDERPHEETSSGRSHEIVFEPSLSLARAAGHMTPRPLRRPGDHHSLQGIRRFRPARGFRQRSRPACTPARRRRRTPRGWRRGPPIARGGTLIAMAQGSPLDFARGALSEAAKRPSRRAGLRRAVRPRGVARDRRSPPAACCAWR